MKVLPASLISLTGVLVGFLPNVLFYLKDAANCSKIVIVSAYQVCNSVWLFVSNLSI